MEASGWKMSVLVLSIVVFTVSHIINTCAKLFKCGYVKKTSPHGTRSVLGMGMNVDGTRYANMESDNSDTSSEPPTPPQAQEEP